MMWVFFSYETSGKNPQFNFSPKDLEKVVLYFALGQYQKIKLTLMKKKNYFFTHCEKFKF